MCAENNLSNKVHKTCYLWLVPACVFKYSPQEIYLFVFERSEIQAQLQNILPGAGDKPISCSRTLEKVIQGLWYGKLISLFTTVHCTAASAVNAIQ